MSEHTTFYDVNTPSDLEPGTLLRLAGGRPHHLEAQAAVTILDAPAPEKSSV